jgi:hypothetical protein
MPTASRLTSAGALLIRGEFDEVTKTTLNLTLANQYAALFDEVTFNTTSPVIKNLLVVTEDFSQWGNSGGNLVTVNQAVAPNGTLTADRIQATTGDYTALLDNPTVGGASYTFSLFVKSVSGASGTWGVNYFNGAHNRTTVPITGEWTRQYITFTGTGGPVNVYAADNRSNLATITDAYVWGAQLERGTTPTIYQGIGAANTLVPPGFAKRETSNGHIYVTDIFDEVTISSPAPSVVSSGLRTQLTPSSYSGSGATWTDTQGNANATLVGSPSYSGATGFTFDGSSQWGTIPSVFGTTDFDNSGSYTIEIWFRPAAGQLMGSSILFGKRATAGAGNGNYPYQMEYSEAGSNLSNYASVVSPFQGNTNAIATNVLPGNWYQNICVWNYTGSSIGGNGADANTVWLNGVKQTISNGNLSTFSSPSNSDQASIARQLGLPPTGQLPGWFKGEIAIVRIYNRALTSTEIQQNFDANRDIFGL